VGSQGVTFELLAGRETPSINSAGPSGFNEVAVLPGRIKDFRENYQDLVLLEPSLSDRHEWWF